VHAGGGDDEPLVYAHCAAAAFGANGTVTLMVANPSSSPVTLNVSLPANQRLEFVLTAPNSDFASRHPVLNGRTDTPLSLDADGALPPMQGVYRAGAANAPLEVPPRSQSFIVLLDARSKGCM